jgi:cephalosporin-C deacetylase
MTKSALSAWVFFSAAIPIVQGQVADPTGSDQKTEVSVKAENPAGRREPGEVTVFTVDISLNGTAVDSGSAVYTLSDDGYAPIESETLALTGRALEIAGKLARPGFLRCEVQVLRPDGEPLAGAKAIAAVAYAPELITPSRETPPDFDGFWSEQKSRLAQVPMEAQLTEVKAVEKYVVPENLELYDTQVRTSEEWPVSGYFSRPKGAAKGSLPAVLWVHGAGVQSANYAKAVEGAAAGYLSFDINAHGIENAQPEAYYRLLFSDGRLKGYPHQGRENRDGVYFRGMFLRLVRAIDFLTAQPEWDGRVLAVMGHSQGGAQAIVAGGLDARVTFIGAGVPAMCDHTGMVRRRISGWPKLVPILSDGKADPRVAEVSRYYDAVNFASRCDAEAVVSVGFIDGTCPPTGCYAAINQLRGQVEVINEPTMGHAAPLHIQQAFWEALKRHTERKKAGADR